MAISNTKEGKLNNVVNERSLFLLTLPIFIDLLLVFLINVVDIWFISQISDEAAASVGAVLQVTGIGFTFFVTLSYAGNAVASQLAGANNTWDRAVYLSLLILMLMVGLFVSLIFYCCADEIARLIGLKGSAYTIGSSYLALLGVGCWLLAIRYGLSIVLTSQGQTQWNMVCSLTMFLVNVLLNDLFIHGRLGIPALGVLGVALSTVIAWCVGVFFTWAVIRFRFHIALFSVFEYDAIKARTRAILSIGLPSVAEPLAWHLSQITLVVFVISYGEVALTARTYLSQVLFGVALFSTALSIGVQTKVSNLIGAKRHEAANTLLMQGVRIGLFGAFMLVSLLIIFYRFTFGIFTTDTAVLSLIFSCLFIAIISECGRVLNLVVGASLKACGDAHFVSGVAVSLMWFMVVPLAWFLGSAVGWGLLGIVCALAVDEGVRGIVMIARWRRGVWRTKFKTTL